jgi:transposase
VKVHVKRGKSDAADAEAICEAVTRPTMRFVEVKTPEQQAILAVHRTRDLIVRQRTQAINGQWAAGTTGRIWHCSASRNLSCSWVRQELPERRANREQSGLPEVAGEEVFELCNQLLFLHSKTLGYSR